MLSRTAHNSTYVLRSLHTIFPYLFMHIMRHCIAYDQAQLRLQVHCEHNLHVLPRHPKNISTDLGSFLSTLVLP